MFVHGFLACTIPRLARRGNQSGGLPRVGANDTYVEHATLSAEELEARIRQGAMFHFSHTMEAQLGGLTSAGFVLTGFYEDRRPEADGNPIRHYMPSFYVVRAEKPAEQGG